MGCEVATTFLVKASIQLDELSTGWTTKFQRSGTKNEGPRIKPFTSRRFDAKKAEVHLLCFKMIHEGFLHMSDGSCQRCYPAKSKFAFYVESETIPMKQTNHCARSAQRGNIFFVQVVMGRWWCRLTLAQPVHQFRQIWESTCFLGLWSVVWNEKCKAPQNCKTQSNMH